MEAGGRVSQNSYIQEIEASGVPEAGVDAMQTLIEIEERQIQTEIEARDRRETDSGLI